MQVVALAPHTSSAISTWPYFLHLLLTLTLFAANMALNHLLGATSFIERLKYLAHEMVYLACGLVVSHLFTATSTRDGLVTMTTLVIYLVVWMLIIIMTRNVIQINPQRVDSLTCATLFVGALSVWFALSNIVEDFVKRGLAGAQ
jgi:hypothetical protein